MAVINVTPDSFSDGGRFDSAEQAIEQALKQVQEGADLLDIGGESTRPGAEPVSEQEELDRVLPVIEGLVARTAVPISIDTVKPAVMRQAAAAGARMINDVNGLRSEGAVELVAELKLPVCIMHMQGQPLTMQQDPRYASVVDDIADFLAQRAQVCQDAGLDPRHIVIDPGFGFGKTLEHNLRLLADLERLAGLGFPVLAGLSRKSMLGAITGRKRPDQRLAASIAAHLIAADRGAAIVRVHDVAETVDALKVRSAVRAVASG
ncbi:MAG: dihydropteroate synthase [Wenzhouxiangella sp.]